jgi:hypothetical protein
LRARPKALVQLKAGAKGEQDVQLVGIVRSPKMEILSVGLARLQMYVWACSIGLKRKGRPKGMLRS